MIRLRFDGVDEGVEIPFVNPRCGEYTMHALWVEKVITVSNKRGRFGLRKRSIKKKTLTLKLKQTGEIK